MVRISLISFLSLILITGFSFKVNTNFSNNNEFFYSMNTVSLVYAGDNEGNEPDENEGQEGSENEGNEPDENEGNEPDENEGQNEDLLNCDEGQHEENGECVQDSPPSLNCDVGEHEENGECVEDSPSASMLKSLHQHHVLQDSMKRMDNV